MTSRNMTYDLDGVFQTRNQGQLISATQTQRKMIRTPGLVPMKKTLAGYVATKPYQGQAGMGDINLPLIGYVSTTTATLAVAGLGLAGVLVYMAMHKRKAA